MLYILNFIHLLTFNAIFIIYRNAGVARIVYVIDPGVAWKNLYDLKQGLDSLVIKPISQASAKQRAGHGWCTGPGKCYRFYTESAYRNEMSPTSIPEIQKINLGATTLAKKTSRGN
jgi:ATP-dependent RNA helicase DHX8/PRP22